MVIVTITTTSFLTAERPRTLPRSSNHADANELICLWLGRLFESTSHLNPLGLCEDAVLQWIEAEFGRGPSELMAVEIASRRAPQQYRGLEARALGAGRRGEAVEADKTTEQLDWRQG